MELLVKLPLPPSECSQNFHGDWRRRMRVTKQYREKCGWAWLSAAKAAGWVQQQSVEVEAVYCCYSKCEGYKARDIQNAIGAMKPAIDAMVDAGIIPGDTKNHLDWGRVELLTTMKDAVKVDGPGLFIRVRPN